MNSEEKYEISLPDPDVPGKFRPIGEPMIKEEALAYVQEFYGADADGRVNLINRLPDDLQGSLFGGGDLNDE